MLFNIVSIACMLWLTPFVPTVGHALSWGVSCLGCRCSLGLLMVALQRHGMTLRIPRPRLTPRMRLLMRRMAPGLVGAGVTQLNLAVDVIIASLLPPGTVSVLYYADRVQQLPLGVIGTAVGTALLPRCRARCAAARRRRRSDTLNRAIEYALFLTLPAALALIVCAYPIISVLFGRGAFDATSVLFSSQSLAAYAIGLPAFVTVKVLMPAFFARGDTAMPVKIGIVCVALNLGLNLAVHGPSGAYRTGAGDQPGGDRQCAVASARSSSGVGISARCAAVPAGAGDGGLLGRHGCRTLGMRAAGCSPRRCTGPCAWPRWAALIAAGMLVYGIAAQLTGAYDLREVGRMMARRRKRRAPVAAPVAAAKTTTNEV